LAFFRNLLDVVCNVLREYNQTLKYSNDWAMVLLKAKLDDTRETLRDARRHYAEHRREHGC